MLVLALTLMRMLPGANSRDLRFLRRPFMIFHRRHSWA
jgi:hypothetical protein